MIPLGSRVQTRQRDAVMKVLYLSARPLSAEEAWKQARSAIPKMSAATAFRNLKILVEGGQARRVAGPWKPARYERADVPEHAHFHCSRCETVYCVAAAPITPPAGCKVESVVMFGRCEKCRGKK